MELCPASNRNPPCRKISVFGNLGEHNSRQTCNSNWFSRLERYVSSLVIPEMSLDDAGLIFLQGDKFLFGFGHAQSYELAYKRYHSAATSGLAEASNMLGLMHENGLGRAKDTNAALYWYRSSDGQHNLDASNNL
jgi:TPR repeat protein